MQQPDDPAEGRRPFVPGYPVDQRRPTQIRKVAQGPFGDFEGKAARVVARSTGERVTLQDDNSSPHTPDLRIDYRDGRVGIGEVVIDTDPRHAQSYEEIRRSGFAISAEPALRRAWSVNVAAACSLKLLRTNLPPLLVALEAEGVLLEEFMLPEQFQAHPHPVVRQIIRLGVVHVHSWPVAGRRTDQIRVTPEGMGGPVVVPWDEFIRDLDTILAPGRWPDVERKLATPDSERHLFIGISHSSSWALNWALDYDQTELPPGEASPRLPGLATHLWLMGTPIGHRCLAWFPDEGWFNVADRWATE